MVTRAPGTVLITGPTGGLGREATLAMARRPQEKRPDLILVGRSNERLTKVADDARAAGATVHEVGCDLADLTDVRAAATSARRLLADGALRPAGMQGNTHVAPTGSGAVSTWGYGANGVIGNGLYTAANPTPVQTRPGTWAFIEDVCDWSTGVVSPEDFRQITSLL